MLGRAAPLVIALALIAPDVQASPECMTKQEARAKWPAKAIYLHGSSRCWNDQPLSSRRSTTPPADKSDSATKALALDSSIAEGDKDRNLFPIGRRQEQREYRFFLRHVHEYQFVYRRADDRLACADRR